MNRPAAALLPLLLAATPALAAERTIAIGSFDRVRVDGAYVVTIATGRSPRATLTGTDAQIAHTEVEVNGSTLVIHAGMRELGAPMATRAVQPLTIALSTPTLIAVTVIGGAQVNVDRLKGPRNDLSVSGTGAIRIDAADTDQLAATVIGNGSMQITGRARAARLITNGPGTIDADGLDAGDLIVRLDGTGETRARARYTATVDDAGLGHVAIAGAPHCTVRNQAGGPVECGTGATRSDQR